jgi:hypothetical protein
MILSARSDDAAYFIVGFGIVFTVLIHTVLYLVHTNMTRGAAREDGCGLIILDIICHWFAGRQIFIRKN